MWQERDAKTNSLSERGSNEGQCIGEIAVGRSCPIAPKDALHRSGRAWNDATWQRQVSEMSAGMADINWLGRSCAGGRKVWR
jgi:hypothetical protein